jgi:hypothetical protein
MSETTGILPEKLKIFMDPGEIASGVGRVNSIPGFSCAIRDVWHP